MFTWKCAVDEMYVTSLLVNYPLKNASIVPALYTFGESASMMQFAYHVRFPTNMHKMLKNEKYVCAICSPIYHLFTHYCTYKCLVS